MEKFDTVLASILGKYGAFTTFLLRFLVGFHLLYAVHGVLFNQEAMKSVVAFFEAQHIILPSFMASFTAWTEAICACLFIAGLFTRLAAIAMIVVFVNAIIIVHLGNPYPDAFPALVMLVGSIYLLFNGAGKYSIDALLVKKYHTTL